MAEKDIVMSEETVSYEGVFSVGDFYKTVSEFFMDRGYVKKETSHTEVVKPEGRFIEISIESDKTLSDYAKSVFELEISMADLKEVVVKDSQGVRQRLHRGKAEVEITSYLKTDYEGKWEGKAALMFVRKAFEKYIYKPIAGSSKDKVVSDSEALKRELEAFFNIEKVKRE